MKPACAVIRISRASRLSDFGFAKSSRRLNNRVNVNVFTMKRKPKSRMPDLHFLDRAPRQVRRPDAPYAVLPIPYERTVSFGHGTALAPDAILRASVQMELFDEELRCPFDLDVHTLPAVDCRSQDDAATLRMIERAALEVLRPRRFLMSFGGEHTITAPLVRAARQVYGEVDVLQVDAHLDLRDHYRGTALSHACVMRRVLEQGARIVHVGIRSACEEDYQLVRERDLPVFWARDIALSGTGEWIEKVVGHLGPRVYVTIDIDGLDAALVPGTGTPEPGGLGWYPLLTLLRRVCGERQVVAADVVETVPLPGTPANEYIAARLAAKLMLYHRLRF